MKKIYILLSLFYAMSFQSIVANKFSAGDGYNNCNMLTNGEFLFLNEFVKDKPDLIIFDIGANIGEWSSEVIKINSTIKIFAFEPNPTTFKKFISYHVNNINISAFNLGLSDKQNDDISFYSYSLSVLDGLYDRPILKDILKEVPTEIKVSISTLDHFCQENSIEHIDLVKIDTEGEEYRILVGASNMLEKGAISAIQFEYGGCYEDSKCKLEDVYNMLRSFHYAIYRLLPNGKTQITEWNPSLENFQYSNYIAILEE